MEIVDNRKSKATLPFGSVRPGNLFEFNDAVYLKADYAGAAYGIGVISGRLYSEHFFTHLVTHINGKVVLEP